MNTISRYQNFLSEQSTFDKMKKAAGDVCPHCKGTGKLTPAKTQKTDSTKPVSGNVYSQYDDMVIKDPKNSQWEKLVKAMDNELRDVKSKLIKRPDSDNKPVGPGNPIFGRITFGDLATNKKNPGIGCSVNSVSNKLAMFYPSFEDANKINKAANESGLSSSLKTNYTEKDFTTEFSDTSKSQQLFVSYYDYNKVVDFVNKLKEIYPDKFKKSS